MCLLAVLDLQGIVVKCTATIFFPYVVFFFDRRIVRFTFLPQTLAAMEIKEQSTGKHQSGCTQF